MITFEPRPIRDRFDGATRWVCPCQDAFGHSAMLEEKRSSAEQVAATTILNYACDQNSDRWQQITSATGAITWHYLGRPAASA